VIVVVPVDRPVRMPDVPIPAIEVLLLLQDPPEVASLKVMVLPRHTPDALRIADIGLTVIVVVAIHPVGSVYVILEVPADTVVTLPLPSIVATPVVLLAQVPPVVASERLLAAPIHIAVVPVIADGNGFTVIIETAPQPLTSV